MVVRLSLKLLSMASESVSKCGIIKSAGEGTLLHPPLQHTSLKIKKKVSFNNFHKKASPHTGFFGCGKHVENFMKKVREKC